jgi:hypothetical protein
MMCLASKASSGQLTMSGLRIHFRSVAHHKGQYLIFDSMAQCLLFSKTYIHHVLINSLTQRDSFCSVHNTASSTQQDVCVFQPVARVIQAVLSLYMHDIRLDAED